MDSAFQKSFLRDFRQGKPEAVLALFGKHPAWNDHMDDLGLSTPSLRTCKKLLYIQGMAANAARQQSTNADVTPYRHLLLWFRGREAILLRLVESEDGRNRGFFPLVGAVHFETTSMSGALRLLIPVLRTFTDGIRALSFRHDVVDQHRHAHDHLRADLQRVPPDSPTDSATSQEIETVRQALGNSSGFVRLRLPVVHYDASQTFSALAAACPSQDEPLLIAQGDTDRFTSLCHGLPDKTDFWFLRERTED